MKIFPPFLAAVVLVSAASSRALRAQQPIAAVDVKKVQRFCDLGFRFTANGIQFDVEKLLGLGLKVDPKVLQALTAQAAVYVAQLTYACRMMAGGFITAETFLAEARTVLQYAKDLEAVRTQSQQITGTPVSEKPDPRLDAGQTAQAELDIKIETAIDTGGELTVILQRLAQRYQCTCRTGR